jgi:shikimate dehydrogenase
MADNSSPPDRYAVVGHPVEHSRSPLIHTLFARQTKQNISYELMDAAPGELEAAVRTFAAEGGKGLNVTVPHKEAAFALCDELGDAASAAGAVNTITIEGARLRGDNTDGIGIVRDITVNQGRVIAESRIVVLGAGGAARGIVGPLLAAGPNEVVVANRNKARAVALIARVGGHRNLRAASFEELAELRPFDMLINATSAGLRGETPPFPTTLIAPHSFCYDLVYSLGDTPFVNWARANGAELAVQGWGMLVEQAAESFYLWRGVRPSTAPILRQFVR